MISEQLSEQDYNDGLLFRKLREDSETWGALERLVKNLSDDVIRQWTEDVTGERSRKWVRGARELCDAILPAMTQMIADSEAVILEHKDIEKTARSPADDGLGSGDMSIS